MNERFRRITAAAARLLSTATPTPKPPVDLTSTDPRLNLARLAAYLDTLPADYEDFDMSTFVRSADMDALAVYAKQNGSVRSCGTAACAVGHGPSAHLFMNADEIESIKEGDEDTAWWNYSDRVFGAPINSPPFEWMFGGGWHYVDNTVHGAAKRIRYFLEHDIPENFRFAQSGASDWLALYADA